MDIISEYELENALLVNRPAMLRSAYRILRNTADAEDAVQEASMKAIENRRKLKNRDSVLAWLLKITVNSAKNIIRSNSRMMLCEEVRYDETQSLNRDAFSDCEIDIAVDELPEPYRETIKRYYYDGYSVNEVASALGISTGTVKSRLSRARAELRIRLLAGISLILLLTGAMLGEIASLQGTDVAVPEAAKEQEEVLTYRYIRIVNAAEDVTEDDICFVAPTGTLYIPARELTSEEEEELRMLRREQRVIEEYSSEPEVEEMKKIESSEETLYRKFKVKYETASVDTESRFAMKSTSDAAKIALVDYDGSSAYDPSTLSDENEPKEYVLGGQTVSKETYAYYCSDLVPTDEREALIEQPAEWLAWKAEVEAQRERDRLAWEEKVSAVNAQDDEADADVTDVAVEQGSEKPTTGDKSPRAVIESRIVLPARPHIDLRDERAVSLLVVSDDIGLQDENVEEEEVVIAEDTIVATDCTDTEFQGGNEYGNSME